MDQKKAFRNIRDILANLYADEESARRVAKDAGLNELHIRFSKISINNWDAILTYAEKSSRVNDLILVVLNEYSDNVQLREACYNYERILKTEVLSSKEQNDLETPTRNKAKNELDTKYDIFIAYSRNDALIMARLHKDLRSEGFSIWTDETELEVGTPSWQAAVEKAIGESRCMVVILSPDAKASEWVGIEITLAKIKKLWIVPVLARGNLEDAVPISLINKQWISIESNYESAVLERLIPSLRRHLYSFNGPVAPIELDTAVTGTEKFSSQLQPKLFFLGVCSLIFAIIFVAFVYFPVLNGRQAINFIPTVESNVL